MLDICEDLFKCTLAYRMDYWSIEGKHMHSHEFLDKHPERKDTPEFTPNEEKEHWEKVGKFAKEIGIIK